MKKSILKTCCRMRHFAVGVRQRICARSHFICHHLGPELKAAIFVASCVVILQDYGWLEDLQIDTLQLAVPQLLKRNPVYPDTYSNEFGSSKVITINDRLYEKNYHQASPLDRQELHKLFSQILLNDNKPSVLAVDLDLSPGPGKETDGEEKLYNLLKQVKGTEIVLITPVKVYSGSLIDKKRKWMEKMCSPHINFGLPTLYISQGAVLKHRRDSNTFANQICRAAVKQGLASNTGEISQCPISSDSQGICSYKGEKLNPYVNARIETPVEKISKLELLNYKAIDYIEPVPLTKDGGIKITDNKLLMRVVFLGGSYGNSDKYETPAGEIAGVYLHAAGYYSLVNPVKDLNHLSTYILEIVMSTVIGIAFYMLATWYRKTRSLFSIITNIMSQFMLAYAFILLAGHLLSFNMWINPAPLIVGMAIHAELVRTEEPYSEVNNTRKLLGIPEIFIKRLFYFGVLLVAWVFIGEDIVHHV